MLLLYPRNSWRRENSDVINMEDAWLHCQCGIYFASEERFQRHKCFVKDRANEDHNKKSGSGTKSYEYENELNDILGNDPIISPTFTFSSDASMASSAEKRKLNESDDSDDTSTSEQASCSTSAPKNKTRKRGTERQRNEMQVFKEYMNEQKEERIRREELQREKMSLMRELIDVMKESAKK
uniref:Uncharacterized protein n=1 Tax=Magallana gigas TaxID=29159 RepID=A0A8W8N6Y2_MAGGI